MRFSVLENLMVNNSLNLPWILNTEKGISGSSSIPISPAHSRQNFQERPSETSLGTLKLQCDRTTMSLGKTNGIHSNCLSPLTISNSCYLPQRDVKVTEEQTLASAWLRNPASFWKYLSELTGKKHFPLKLLKDTCFGLMKLWSHSSCLYKRKGMERYTFSAPCWRHHLGYESVCSTLREWHQLWGPGLSFWPVKESCLQFGTLPVPLICTCIW